MKLEQFSRKISIEIPRPAQQYITEAYNALRANLLFGGENIRSIAMVGCTSGEGTTSVVRRLALALTDVGKNVLVMDANMHEPADAGNLQTGEKAGSLCEYLSGNCAIEECILRTPYDDLYLLSGGTYAGNPAELLTVGGLGTLLMELRDVFDYILIDCPPLSSTIDGAIVAKVCDASVIVLESDKTQPRLLKDVKKQLERADSRILGVILNKFDVKRYKCYGNYFASSGRKEQLT